MLNLTEAMVVIAKNKPQIIFVSGPPGSGKDKVSADIVAKMRDEVKPIWIDEYSDESGAKWLVNIENVTDRAKPIIHDGKIGLISGTCDNWGDLVLAFAGTDKICLFIYPDYEVFTKAMAAKAKDYDGGEKLFADYFLKNSKLSEAEFKKYYSAKEQLFLKWWGDSNSFFVYSNKSDGKEITKGWHQDDNPPQSMVGEHTVILHPDRDVQAEKLSKSAKTVIFVDGLTEKTVSSKVLLFITNSEVEHLSVHAKSGVYNGKSFDNSTSSECLLVDGDVVVMSVPASEIIREVKSKQIK